MLHVIISHILCKFVGIFIMGVYCVVAPNDVAVALN